MKLTKIHTWTTFVLGNLYASLIWATIRWEGLPIPTITTPEAPAVGHVYPLYVISGVVTLMLLIFIFSQWQEKFFNEDK